MKVRFSRFLLVILSARNNSGSSNNREIEGLRCSARRRKSLRRHRSTTVYRRTMWRELLPPWTTSNTPSTIVEINTPSVNELTGGESTSRACNVACSAVISRASDPIQATPRDSAESVRRSTHPVRSPHRLRPSPACLLQTHHSTGSNSVLLARRMSKMVCKRGRRMSASMITTLAPVCARLIAGVNCGRRLPFSG